jgi:hypothetical protein
MDRTSIDFPRSIGRSAEAKHAGAAEWGRAGRELGFFC